MPNLVKTTILSVVDKGLGPAETTEIFTSLTPEGFDIKLLIDLITRTIVMTMRTLPLASDDKLPTTPAPPPAPKIS